MVTQRVSETEILNLVFINFYFFSLIELNLKVAAEREGVVLIYQNKTKKKGLSCKINFFFLNCE